MRYLGGALRYGWLFLGVVACTSTNVDKVSHEVVYGEDGRTKVFAHPNASLRALAPAIAMKIDEDNLIFDGGDVFIDYDRTLSEARSLCAGEAFEDQLEPGTCSGTLIDDRYILTAGHCMDSASDCTDKVWVLGWRYTADDELIALQDDDVYSCQRVLAYFDDDRVDHAIVELDRPVVGHTPVSVRIERAGLPVGTPLALVGHPNGIPMKIDSGGVVTVNHSSFTSLRATLDAFNGNSGSGVFDHSGNLVALLRGGETDYVDAGGCNVVNVIDPPPTDDGEGLVYAAPVIDAFCATPGVESVVCDCDGPCVEPPEGDRCSTAETIEPVNQTIRDTLVGFAPDSEGSCGGLGPERVYSFTLPAPGRMVAQTAGFDTVMYLRAACDGLELGCNDDIDRDTNRGSRLDERLAIGTYFLFVDAYDSDVSTFSLQLTFTLDDDAAVPAVDAGNDADLPDSSVSHDAGVGDSGVDAGEPIDEGGCGCRTSQTGDATWLVLLLLWANKRRVQRSSARNRAYQS